jgi:MoaA/NifB/PqqE/SkfB family radical SAM enzyme
MPLLDVVLGYDCNLKCGYCTITDAMRLRSLPTEVVAREIEAAALRGWKEVAFTGGEPTIFPDLAKLVRFAKKRGFEQIKVASNGLRYAHEPFLDHLIESGVNVFHMSMHAFEDAAYERTVARLDTARLRRQAIGHLVSRGHAPVADLILKNDTYGALVPWIASLVDQGIRRFDLWLVSLTDQNAGKVDQLPQITALVPELVRAFDAARAGGYEVRALHVPRCFVPGYEGHVRHPGVGGVRVVTPDEVFDLAGSRLTGGVKPEEACGRCRYRDECPGLRKDYVGVFGTGELRPVLPP